MVMRWRGGSKTGVELAHLPTRRAIRVDPMTAPKSE